MATEQDLIDGLHQGMEAALEGSTGRSVVVRIALSGRGPLHGSLRQPNFIEGVVDTLNGEWAERSPFAWCERIEDETAPPFNREERVEGSDFLSEVLKTADSAKEDPEMQARLRGGLDDLYRHRRYRKHVSEDAPDEDDLSALIDEAESIVIDLLAGDDA